MARPKETRWKASKSERGTQKHMRGFYQVPRLMSSRYGHSLSSVYGVIANFCNMRGRHCTASQDTIAKTLKMSRGTINKYIDRLVSLGYLIDLTPGRVNSPHTYRVTDKLLKEENDSTLECIDGEENWVDSDEKAGMEDANPAVQELVSNPDASEGLVLKNCTAVSTFDTPGCPETEQPGVQILNTSNTLLKEYPKDNSENNPPTPAGGAEGNPQNAAADLGDAETIWSRVLEKLVLSPHAQGMQLPEWEVQGWTGRALNISITIDHNQFILQKHIQPAADGLIREVTGCPQARVAFNAEAFQRILQAFWENQ